MVSSDIVQMFQGDKKTGHNCFVNYGEITIRLKETTFERPSTITW